MRSETAPFGPVSNNSTDDSKTSNRNTVKVASSHYYNKTFPDYNIGFMMIIIIIIIIIIMMILLLLLLIMIIENN